MKKLFFFCFMLIFPALCFSAPKKSQKKMYVSSNSAELKTSASFFSGKSGSVEYGEAVFVIETDGKWSKIRSDKNPEISGWISSSLLSKRKLISVFNNFSANADEIALAGKGFSESDGWGKSNANYKAVGIIENLVISNEDLLKFIVEGELKNE